ncbi:MAG: molybdopterin synthase catalytic subunit MoaE [Sulfuritalea sp.]|jgi:molybdopterin synthase catalytic subunit|nr:molybdopterin synthase catalytic subunit MoaE [Sulfuritalea sp.]
MSISVQEADFDAGAEIAALSTGRDDVGAVASFVGLVRADKATEAKVSAGTQSAGAGETAFVAAMTLEHYPGMTEKALEAIVAEARGRWDIFGVRVIHRVGRLLPGDRIVLVAVASSHRHDAFAACEFIMDYLKTRAPFWKKEETPDGGRWVDARESDDHAAGRWNPAE